MVLMWKASRLICLSLLVSAIFSACSNSTPPAVVAPTTVAVAPAPLPAKPAPLAPADAHKACSLVTAAEMSAILGNIVAASANDTVDGGTSTCSYAPASGSGPRAEVMISWGDGESALQMIRAMKEHDAARDLPYQGIGDDAVYQSPAAIVREGKDLFGVAIFGRTDVPAVVKKIIDTAGAKLEVASVAKDAETKRGHGTLASAR